MESALFFFSCVRSDSEARYLGNQSESCIFPMSNGPNSTSGHESFVRALARHERVIRGYIRGAGVARPEDVDEIVQEVSLIAWQKFDQLENVEEFPRWACVIARYRVLEFRRKRFRDRLVLNEGIFELLLDEALEETELQESRLRHLENCIAGLPDATRNLVLVAYQPGASIDQIARSTGKKANSLYQQLWRIRQTLKACVQSAMNAGHPQQDAGGML